MRALRSLSVVILFTLMMCTVAFGEVVDWEKIGAIESRYHSIQDSLQSKYVALMDSAKIIKRKLRDLDSSATIDPIPVTTKGSGIKLYKEPFVLDGFYRELPPDTTVLLVEFNKYGGFYHVATGARNGYIIGRHLDVSNVDLPDITVKEKRIMLRDFLSRMNEQIENFDNTPNILNELRRKSTHLRTVYINTFNLPIRRRPSATSGIINTVKQGESVYLKEESRGWAMVRYEDQDSWVHSKYLSVTPVKRSPQGSAGKNCTSEIIRTYHPR